MGGSLLATVELWLAEGRKQAACRLLMGQEQGWARELLDRLSPDGSHGCVLVERLRFGPPESWLAWRKGVGKVALKLGAAPLAEAARGFRHPQVAPLLEAGPDWRVFGWVEGRKLAEPAVLHDAVAALHRAGLVHGDVTPANVVVNRDGLPVLIDWGDEVAGTPGWGDHLGDPQARDLYGAERLLTWAPPAANRP